MHQALDPVVEMLTVYRRASRWRAIRECWKAGSRGARTLCLALLIAALALAAMSVVADWATRWGLGYFCGCAICTVAASVLYQTRMVASHPLLQGFKPYDRHFGLHYRILRYRMFRAALLRKNTGRSDVAKALATLNPDLRFVESRPVDIGPGAVVLLSAACGTVTSASMRDSWFEAGLPVFIVCCFIIAAFLLCVLRFGLPTERQRHSELACFLQWYVHELKLAQQAGSAARSRKARNPEVLQAGRQATAEESRA
ncbi:hypothetical protein CAL13_10820 [Bordetella genomosp. 9]|uniref:Uncharacterized protein n=2 Tax=Bordetella genomosp. 9 TaxID=1416803 RepID=A0A1W6YZV9_9BORD|nr:hypothetical protein CAL13_10820 [Bordetella genomosp. 9]